MVRESFVFLMKRPKLLFLVTEDWYFVSHRLPLAIAAIEAGFEVVVATQIKNHGPIIRNAGIKLIPLELSRRRGNPIREILSLRRLYRNERPDIIHQVALKPVLYGSIAALALEIPRKVNAVAGLGWLFTSSTLDAQIIRRVVRPLLGFLLSRSSCQTIVQNPDDQKILILSGVPQNQISLIRGAGVDTKKFFPIEEPLGPVTIILAARMLWAKGVHEFILAAQCLNKEGVFARFVLVGEPDKANPGSVPHKKLREWDGKHGVEWWGYKEDMTAVLQNAHIACLPSFYGEGLPKSLLEAAACGLPIVTTDTPGCREVVEDGSNGFLVPAKNVGALMSALKQLIIDVDLRRTMGKRSRTLAQEKFSQEIVIAETLSIYYKN